MLHEARATTRAVIGYHALLTQSVIGRWEVVPQYNTLEPFIRPWIEGPDAVKRAIGDEPRPH